jgi:hypothetical protein
MQPTNSDIQGAETAQEYVCPSCGDPVSDWPNDGVEDRGIQFCSQSCGDEARHKANEGIGA